MTTKKAIELIHMDIDYYRKQAAIMETFKDEFIKKHDWNNSDPDSIQSMIGDIAQSMYKIMSSSYVNQIKYYDDILSELKSTKSKKHY